MKKLLPLILLFFFASCSTTYETRKINGAWSVVEMRNSKEKVIYRVPNWREDEFLFREIKPEKEKWDTSKIFLSH